MADKNKELVLAEEKAVATSEEQFDSGLGEMDESDFIIPRLNIAQPTTIDVDPADIGKLLLNLTGDCKNEMRVAIFRRTKSRSLFPEVYDPENKPLCRSYDSKVPAGDIEGAEPMCETCAKVEGDKDKFVCPYANWGADKTPPRCQESLDFLLIDLDTYIPMFFSCRSTATKAARKVVSTLNILTAAHKAKAFAFSVTLGTEKYKNGPTYIPTFSKPHLLEPDEIEILAGIWETLKTATVKDTTDESQASFQDAAKPAPKNDEQF